MTFGDVMAKTTGEEPSGAARDTPLCGAREHQPTLDSAQVGHSEAHPDGVRRGDARTAEPLRHGRRWPRRREARG
jgi:hypothetical protein